jgi:protein-S-isoprenylcysteine O-methyltransferase Ste14
MKKLFFALYGSISYLTFLAAFLYAIGFVGNILVPQSVDSGGLATPLVTAIIVNCLLLSVFVVQHSGMARKGFKKVLTTYFPAEMERSTYVLATNAVLFLMFWQWRPMPEVVWSVEHTVGAAVLQATFWIGWVVVLLSTLMINHFDLFGLRQTWLAVKGTEYKDLGFRTPGFYGYVRHPIQVGFLIAFWATPTMTAGHLLFAVMTTGYIFLAVKLLEERDLMREHPERYGAYMDQVPGFVPRLTKPSQAGEPAVGE